MAKRKKLLVTGAGGFLGWNLCRAAADRYDLIGVSHHRPVVVPGGTAYRCDLSDAAAVEMMFNNVAPDAVVHGAAMANPNDCERQPDASRSINVDASLRIAECCSRRRIPCVFISTDLVFDGRHPPYSEISTPCPISTYGAHKLAAEQGMRERCGDLLVCRVPLMYGDAPPAASSFIQPLIAALREGREITLFTDEFRTPACGASVALGILLALETTRGILHLGGRERISRYDFGVTLAAALGVERPKIKGVLQRETTMIAPRPPDVSFDSSRAFALGYAPLTIADELARLVCVKNS